MKSLIVLLVSLLVPAAALVPEGSVVVKWGDVLKNHPSVEMAMRIAQEVAERTDGEIEIRVFTEGRLGGSKDMIDAVIFGSQQIVIESPAFLLPYFPRITVFDAPYLWRNIEHMYSVLEGPIGSEIKDGLIESRGIRVLGTTYYGTRHFTSTEKPVFNAEDLRGFRLRVQQHELAASMAKAWGAVPQQINFNETYFALKEGLVDGQENPLPTIEIAGFTKVQRYLTLSGHAINPRHIFINEKFWQRLSERHRTVLKSAIDSGIAWHNNQVVELEKTLVTIFRNRGMTVITPKTDDFRKAVVQAMLAEYEPFWGKGLYEKIASWK